ncbi:SIMPL domain-containing protein [Nakamurella flavida]|uniref:SIMPL domain-containing protein n=1 Tax=Nakamurella flavida TaxID=363630 RepID=A0A938YHS9_9ACTN|nr:SIMPL domain-containing protein [Nakamurella flavida]MBM9475344.1 SIMPL domain-containing protein [Nakamurella flavida]MDP9776921.1 uncharacterized protein YggE [Nakamurella flavida]
MSATQTRVVLAGLAGLTTVLVTACSSGAGNDQAVDTGGASPLSPTQQAVEAVAAATTSAVPDAPSGGLRLITTLGTGQATGVPDIVTVTLGVQTAAATAQAALDDNNQRSAGLLTALKAQGVADADIQTNQVSVQPSYDQAGGITGYQVSNMVTATIRPLASAGAVLDAVTQATGDAIRIQWIALSIDDDTPVRAQARADAVVKAKAQAEQLAAAAGVTLGPVFSVVETPLNGGGAYQSYAASSAAAGSPVPIEAGTQDVSVQVQVAFEMR